LKNTDSEVIARLSGLLKDNTAPVVVVPHSNPDGDAIGSAYGLAVVLKNYGHSVKVISPNDFPGFLNWLNGEIDILNFQKQKKQANQYIQECGVLFCVDFNDIRRTGDMKKVIESFSGTTVMIDHHPDPVNFCDFCISEPEYSSTAELVYDFVAAAGLEQYIDHQSAEALFTGIMTDTGSFSHNTSRPNLYRVLSSLMVYGINTEEIHNRIYHNFSADRIRLMGYCLHEKMVVLPEYRTGYISITRDELKKYNFVPGDTEGFVNIPLTINNIVFSALFIEKEGNVKVSFRSKGDFPANAFAAAHFGGGGHLNAAGGEIKLTLTEALENFRQLLPDYLHLLSSNNVKN
jgi:bifunctional oligoribonuclease and PAP phosphatase NrnA